MEQAYNSEEQIPAAEELGAHIREARKKRDLTIAELSEALGRPREWLNRIELGYSERGDCKPLSRTELQTLIDVIGDNFTVSVDELRRLADAAERQYESYKLVAKNKKRSFGKLTHTEVIIGEKQIIEAILDLINEQHSDAIIRNTGVKSLGNYQNVTTDWKNYRHALGEFLSKNPNALFKRVEYAATPQQLLSAREADEKLAGNRTLESVHNVKLKFHIENPLQMHVVIGQREAILALPQTSGQAGSNIALLIRDRVFVEALRVWYDEVLWDAPTTSQSVNFSKFDESFEIISKMYGFN